MVERPTFCVSGTSGDMEAEVPQGLFFRDMRSSPTGMAGPGGRPPAAPPHRAFPGPANSCWNVGATSERGCARTSGCPTSVRVR
ncbi:glycogen debranching N-terminal domain-containing protein [Streptomyces avermitilis]|uniref:glycogen debranching N-terminal domain-containing protein n=1 Tax=Streptomyces avermitilis TaxID=33903 RepID=UPI0033A10F41